MHVSEGVVEDVNFNLTCIAPFGRTRPGTGTGRSRQGIREQKKSTTFQAGRLALFENKWRNLTSDERILDIALHCHIELTKIPEKQIVWPMQFFTAYERKIIDVKIEKLLDMNVVEQVEFNENDEQFISPIFTVPKKDGEYRMILNLKEFNETYVVYHHFKMDSFETALKLVKPNCFMASIDLRHGYYSVPIASEHRKYLRFRWRGKIYQYTCLANGLASAPRLFTKLIKNNNKYAKLRRLGYKNSGYIDDSFLLGDTMSECSDNVKDTVSVMEDVGFIIHQQKSVFVPTQNIVFLGNHIDSVRMIV
jgi:hypothetical protein